MEVDQSAVTQEPTLPVSVAATVSLSPEPGVADGDDGSLPMVGQEGDDDAMTSVASTEPEDLHLDDLVQIDGDSRVILNGRQGIITGVTNWGGKKNELPNDWFFHVKLNAQPPGAFLECRQSMRRPPVARC